MGRTRRIRAVAAAAGLLAMATAGCTTSGSGAEEPAVGSRNGSSLSFDGRVLKLSSALHPFSACDGLLGYLHKEAASRVTAYGLDGIGFGYRVGVMEDGAKASSAVSEPATTTPSTGGGSRTPMPETAGGGSGATPDFSATNTVEAGIDEGDTVKTDGENLYLLSQGKLRIVTAASATPRLLSTLDLRGFGTQLVLVGDQVLIAGQAEMNQDGAAARWNGNQSSLWQIDVSDPSDPKVMRQLIVDGSVLSIRLTDHTARVVVQSPPQGLSFVSPSGPGSETRALETNKDVIAESTVEDWMGRYQLLDGKGKKLASGPLADCKAVGVPAEFHGFNTTTVLSIDMTGALGAPDGTAVLADGQQVYATGASLYVAIGDWQDQLAGPNASPSRRSAPATTIHRFSLDPARATYQSTGTVDGSLMNDFSMSELDGVLRVATTTQSTTGRTESQVTTLAEHDGELAEIGQVGDLGRGEQIKAVRFIGTNGYVVTFRQTDPLYVIDLSDPTDPAVAGELKVDGYSGYLHPMGDGRILGVGASADSNGRITGAQVSVFDVSDPARPQRDAVYQLAGAALNTEWDYHSFLWWESEHLALIVGNVQNSSLAAMPGVYVQNNSVVLGLDVGETISERGRISNLPAAWNPVATEDPSFSCPYPYHDAESVPADKTSINPLPAAGMPPMGCVTFMSPISRPVIVGGSVFSISETAVQVNDLKSFRPLGAVELRMSAAEQAAHRPGAPPPADGSCPAGGEPDGPLR